MKKIFFIVGLFLVSWVTPAQNLQKQYYENVPSFGGDVIVKSSEITLSNNDEIKKTFEVEAPTDGTYYLDAWLSAPFTPEGYPEYKVIVNNVILKATLKPQTSTWESVALTDLNKSATAIKLKKGLNSISIIGEKLGVPNIENIKLSSSVLNAGISDSKYKAYIEDIKANTLDLSSELLKLPNDSVVPYGIISSTYTYQLNMPVPYTTAYILAFDAGTNVNISVKQSSGYEYLIEFFDMNHFTNSRLSHTWSQFCQGNGSLSITIPETAFYFIRLRAYRQMSSGLAQELRINDRTYSSCPISGNGIAYIGSSYQTDVITSHSQYQMGLFLQGSGLQGSIREYKLVNTTWPNGKYGCQLYMPDLLGLGAGLVSSYNSSYPLFYADLYLGLTKVSQGTLNYFPNLKPEESYCSAPGTNDYNCISWTVGVTNEWIWPSSSSLAAWDAFYNSYGYTRSGATADNAAIAVWKLGAVFEHGSVRKNSLIPNPHGFDWESKCGGLERVMHLRDALAGSSYGDIAYYYRPTSGTVNSLAASSDVKRSTFSSTDLSLLDALKTEISSDVISEFDAKYAAWKKTWDNPEIAMSSNPRSYAESKEYSVLLQFCQKYGKVTWPLFIDKLAEGDVFVSNLLEDLTAPKKENKKIYDEAVSLRSRVIGIPSPFIYSNMVEYSKRLLAQENINIKTAIKAIAAIELENIDVNITADKNNIILAINTEIETPITVNIYDVYGVSVYNANYNVLSSGWGTTISTVKITKGIYVVQIVINGKIISQKVNI